NVIYASVAKPRLKIPAVAATAAAKLTLKCWKPNFRLKIPAVAATAAVFLRQNAWVTNRLKIPAVAATAAPRRSVVTQVVQARLKIPAVAATAATIFCHRICVNTTPASRFPQSRRLRLNKKEIDFQKWLPPQDPRSRGDCALKSAELKLAFAARLKIPAVAATAAADCGKHCNGHCRLKIPAVAATAALASC